LISKWFPLLVQIESSEIKGLILFAEQLASALFEFDRLLKLTRFRIGGSESVEVAGISPVFLLASNDRVLDRLFAVAVTCVRTSCQ
jgi:hypothetical protein